MPSFGRELEKTLHRALNAAQSRDHEFATLEHLLLALLDDPDAHTALLQCGAKLPQLQSQLTEYLNKEIDVLRLTGIRQKKRKTKKDKETIQKYDTNGPDPTAAFQRVVQRSILHVQSSGRDEVSGANVLVALFSERDSYAVNFLKEQDVTRLDVVTWISHGVGKGPRQYQEPAPATAELSPTTAKSSPLAQPPATPIDPVLNRAFRDDLRAVFDSIATEPVLNTPRIADKMVEFALDLVSQAAMSVTGSERHHRPLLTFGLYGPWGSGKSTLLRSVATRMEREGMTTVFVNTWKWDGITDVYSFMSEELLSSLSRRNGTRWKAISIRTLIAIRSNYLRLIVVISILIVGITGYMLIDWSPSVTTTEVAKGSLVAVLVGGIAAILAKPLGSFIERIVLRERRISSRDTLSWSYKYLSLTKRVNYSTHHRPIVFLFDDLDRCADTRVVEFLQSIHSLTSDGSICVVACDEDFVTAALYSHFKGVAEFLEEGKAFGARFLEKIIQLPFRMPEISAEDLSALGLGLPKMSGEDHTAQTGEFDPRREPTGEAESAADNAGQLVKDLGRTGDASPLSEVRLSEICAETLALVVEPCRLQIRQIKMLSNMIKLYSMIFPPPDEVSAEKLAAFIVVNYIDPDWIPQHYFGSEKTSSNKALEILENEVRTRLGDDREPLDVLYRLCGIR